MRGMQGEYPPLWPSKWMPLEMYPVAKKICKYSLTCWCSCDDCKGEIHHCGHEKNCHVFCKGELMPSGKYAYAICAVCLMERQTTRNGIMVAHNRWDKIKGAMVSCRGSFQRPKAKRSREQAG